MGNPFDHLRQRRERFETEEQRQLAARREAQRRQEEVHLLQLTAAAPYDAVVLRVLTQLQQATYPASQVRNHRTAQDTLHDHLRGSPAWSIGRTDAYWATDSIQEQAWYPEVVVRVESDANNQPVFFACCRVPGFCVRTWFGRKFVEPHKRCDLSEQALVQALSELYPAGELEGPGWLGGPALSAQRNGNGAVMLQATRS
jgi:hypothetical protein